MLVPTAQVERRLPLVLVAVASVQRVSTLMAVAPVYSVTQERTVLSDLTIAFSAPADLYRLPLALDRALSVPLVGFRPTKAKLFALLVALVSTVG